MLALMMELSSSWSHVHMGTQQKMFAVIEIVDADEVASSLVLAPTFMLDPTRLRVKQHRLDQLGLSARPSLCPSQPKPAPQNMMIARRARGAKPGRGFNSQLACELRGL